MIKEISMPVGEEDSPINLDLTSGWVTVSLGSGKVGVGAGRCDQVDTDKKMAYLSFSRTPKDMEVGEEYPKPEIPPEGSVVVLVENKESARVLAMMAQKVFCILEENEG